MTIKINGLQLSTISTIDEVLIPTWRDGKIPESKYERLYDVTLNDAWISINDGVIKLQDGDNYVVLFEDSFVKISIY